MSECQCEDEKLCLVSKIMTEAVAKTVCYHILFERKIVNGDDIPGIFELVCEVLDTSLGAAGRGFDNLSELEELLLVLRELVYEEVCTLLDAKAKYEQ